MIEDFYKRSLGLNLTRVDQIQISVIGYITRTFERLLHYVGALHDCFKCKEDLDEALPVVKAYNDDLIDALKWRGVYTDHPDRIILLLFCRNVQHYFDNFVDGYTTADYCSYDKIELATDELFEAGKYASMILTASNADRMSTKYMNFYVTSFINKLFTGVLDKYLSDGNIRPKEDTTSDTMIRDLTVSIVYNACNVCGTDYRDWIKDTTK